MILKPDVSQKKRILVVDDEVDITTVFKLGLEEADLQVDAYTDPVLALSEYKPGSEQKPAIWFITAHEDYRSQFKNLFQTLEEEDRFLKKPILLHDLVKSVKTRLGL